jgi:NAD(P)-dependent dehydrogenase (short-subunit alcohol dehydrogenase family)
VFRDQTKEREPLAKLISLAGKKALITGAASGIGKATAYRFAEAGADLELVNVNEAKLQVTRDELSKLNVQVTVHKLIFARNQR